MNALSMDIGCRDDQIEISPAGGDGFSLLGRPYVAWRAAGSEAFEQAVAERLESTRQSDGQVSFRATVGPLRLDLVAASDATGGHLAGRIQSSAREPIEVARVHYLHGGTPPGVGLIAVNKGTDMAQWIGRDADLEPPNRRRAEAAGRVHVTKPVLREPIGDGAGWCVAEDVGLLTEGWDRPGWTLGAIGPGTAFGQVGFSSGGAGPFAAAGAFFIGTWLEGIRLEPGQTRRLETLRLAFGDLQDGIRDWARHAALEMGRRGPAASPVGFCSWYQWGHGIDQPTFERAIDEFAALPIPPGGRLVQLDDGYQKMPGDWRPNERFSDFASLPARIAATGSIPGLWIAPALLHESHPAYQEHPDWIQRKPDGSPCAGWANWGWVDGPAVGLGKPEAAQNSRTYYLETDHPEVREFIRSMIRDAVAAGWRYLKLDFTQNCSSARGQWGRSRTTFESMRDLYRLMREAAGPEITINACIGGADRYALGYADASRCAGDTGGNFGSVRDNLRRLWLLQPTNGRWWALDPDVFYLRDNTKLSPEASFLLTGTLGLMGGLLLTSDLPSQWNAAAELPPGLAPFWNDRCPAFPVDCRLAYNADGLPRACRVSYETEDSDGRPSCQVGLYNWSDQPADVSVELTALRLDAAAVAITRQLGPEGPCPADEGPVRLETADSVRLVSPAQPPQSLRIVTLEPAHPTAPRP